MTHKFNAKKVTADGVTFDSKGEHRRYQELRLMQMGGAISDLRLKPKYELLPAFKRDGKRIGAITFTPDFEYIEDGRIVVEDFKGVETTAFRLKRKLFLHRYPDRELRITR